jgi:hypothetical protein
MSSHMPRLVSVRPSLPLRERAGERGLRRSPSPQPSPIQGEGVKELDFPLFSRTRVNGPTHPKRFREERGIPSVQFLAGRQRLVPSCLDFDKGEIVR